MQDSNYRAGFVSIIGKPNVGKSTLLNRLVGERLAIITPKAQTTRHRIMGINTGEDFQIVYSDTPGILEPKYELHKAMMDYVRESLEDADVILWVTDTASPDQTELTLALPTLQSIETPVFLLLNKTDICKPEQIAEKRTWWASQFNFAQIFEISGLTGTNIEQLNAEILALMPVHPAYYPEDDLTTRSERFFASEIIREKIFMNYEQEIPYACEVLIMDFKDKGDMLVIRAEIIVERESQKGIVIGKKGEALKKVGIQARQTLEEFFGKKVYLEQHVKVEKDWRKRDTKLKHYGY
jgi:GTP-binding protein Era